MRYIPTKPLTFHRLVAAFTVVFGVMLVSEKIGAQEINFDQINKFESLGPGTLHVGALPKTIIDDGDRHVVILTIWNATRLDVQTHQ